MLQVRIEGRVARVAGRPDTGHDIFREGNIYNLLPALAVQEEAPRSALLRVDKLPITSL